MRTRARQRRARRLSMERLGWRTRSVETKPRRGFEPRRHSRYLVRLGMRGASPTPDSCSRPPRLIWQQRSTTWTRAHGSSASSVTSTTRCWASSNLAWKCYELGDRERARALHEETLRRGRATSNMRIEAISMAALAVYAIDE